MNEALTHVNVPFQARMQTGYSADRARSPEIPVDVYLGKIATPTFDDLTQRIRRDFYRAIISFEPHQPALFEEEMTLGQLVQPGRPPDWSEFVPYYLAGWARLGGESALQLGYRRSLPKLDLHDLFRQMENAKEETSGDDGIEGIPAVPVSEATTGYARTFLRLIADTTDENPEIEATPQGEFAFSWHRPNGDGITVLVLPSGEIALSGIFGRLNLAGTVPWNQEKLPNYVTDTLRWTEALP